MRTRCFARGSFSLVDALQFDVEGVTQPVNLCASPPSLDPSPCVAARQVSIGSTLASLDSNGDVRVASRIGLDDARMLANSGARIFLPILVDGKQLASLDWALSFARSADIVYSGTSSSTRGPDLRVLVDRRDPARYVFEVHAGGEARVAVVDQGDLWGFRVVARGASGRKGLNGSNGSAGIGDDGGDGDDGTPGGNGGDVTVAVDCGGASDCSDTVEQLKTVVLSQGGRGGEGGYAGRGGSSEIAGASRDGDPGRDGAPGQPGRVSIAVAPAR